jgi:hypothetical protein
MYFPVFRIRDSLVRIRIRGSVPGTYQGLTDPNPGPDPQPALFVSDLQDTNKKQFFLKFFCLLRYGTSRRYINIILQR